MDALQLLSGNTQHFLDEVWARRVHVHHADPARLIRFLRLDDVDALLTSAGLRTPALRLAQDGDVLPAANFTRAGTLAGQPLTGLVDARKVLALFDAGATVVLQGLQRYWPPLTGLVRDLEFALGHPCQANAYLTPPGSQGFARHRDTHDVFVFGTYGAKRWEVYDDSGRCEVLLEPGVCMYLPTGTPHAARTEQSPALHVTMGINRITWRDLLHRLARQALEDGRYDEPLPAGYLARPSLLGDALRPHLEALHRDLQEDPARAADDQVRRFLTTRPSLLRGGLRDLLGIDDLGDNTLLERRSASGAPLLQPDGDRLRVLVGDRELRMPLRLAEPLAVVRDNDTLRPRDLAPWLDQHSRLVLARRLVREGLLRIAG